MSRADHQFKLRIPNALLGRIKEKALLNKRSMNAEILLALEDKFPENCAPKPTFCRDPADTLKYAIKDRLVNTAPVTALVPETSILDMSSRPELFPSIILGKTQSMLGLDLLDRSVAAVFLNLHIWTREKGMTSIHEIMGSIRKAMRTSSQFNTPDADYAICDAFIEDTRTMNDPDGETAHGVITVKAYVQETWVGNL